MGFTRAQLDGYRNATVPDLVGPGLRLLFVGINPSLWTAAVGAHFAHPGNRFYPALHRAGITDHLLVVSGGMQAGDRAHLIDRGIGITNLVNRATSRAAELGGRELQEGVGRLEQFVAEHRPPVVAVAGITAYRTAFRRRGAGPGRQPEALAGRSLWVVPNPSGLNAHETVESLADAYRSVARMAGIVA